jgi:hypothetical protein
LIPEATLKSYDAKQQAVEAAQPLAKMMHTRIVDLTGEEPFILDSTKISADSPVILLEKLGGRYSLTLDRRIEVES